MLKEEENGWMKRGEMRKRRSGFKCRGERMNEDRQGQKGRGGAEFRSDVI